jgi:transcriptional activator of cad operon
VNSTASDARLLIGPWRAERASGELTGPQGTVRLEPKVMDLLFLLAAQPGEVVTREQIFAALWPGVIVGEDTLARTVSKLRRALGDDARAPAHIETLSKRGYRLIAQVRPVEPQLPATEHLPAAFANLAPALATAPRRPARRARLVAAIALAALLGLGAALVWRPGTPPATPVAPIDLVARADDFYFQYARRDNEAAIELYQRVLGAHPDHAPALAGLANALVQREMRWPSTTSASYTRLGDALAAGHLRSAVATRELARARQLASRAVALAPELAAAHKALGLVLSAQAQFEPALRAYEAALAHDPDAWGAMINIGDVLEIQGRAAEALPWFERAFDAMTRSYAQESARVRPWQSALGVLIGDRHRARGDRVQAEAWYRRVLAAAPLDEPTIAALITLLREAGEADAAAALCREHAALALPREACAPD